MAAKRVKTGNGTKKKNGTMANKGKVALGAILGAAVGVVAGVLTAPKSGKETRDDLKAKADDLKNQTKQKADQVKTKAETVAGDVKKKADEAVSGIKNSLQ